MDQHNDEIVLQKLQNMKEVSLHKKIILPLLKAMEFEYIRYVHGGYERGKDILYITQDKFDLDGVEVCQVKNSPFNGRMTSKDSTAEVLRQIHTCKTTKILNPKTNTKELPRSVILFTMYSLSDKNTSDQGVFLEQLKSMECKILGPEDFIRLLKKHLPNAYWQLAAPGGNIKEQLILYLDRTNETWNIGAKRQIKLKDYYVNIGTSRDRRSIQESIILAKKRKSFTNKIEKIEKKKEYSDERIKIPLSIYNETLRLYGSLPDKLKKYPLLSQEQKVVVSGYDQILDKFDLLGFIKHSYNVFKDYNDPQIYIEIMVSFENFVGYIFKMWGYREIMGDIEEIENELSKCLLESVRPDAILKTKDNICIIGGAGAGKTSLARMIAYEALNSGLKCIYFPCSQIRFSTDHLKEQLEKFLGGICNNVNKNEIKKYLSQSQIFIFDGCDESATFESKLGREINDYSFDKEITLSLKQYDESSIKYPSRIKGCIVYNAKKGCVSIVEPLNSLDFNYLRETNKEIIANETLNQIESEYHKNVPKIIVTSRTEYQLKLNSSFHVLSVNPLSDKQLEEFYTKWFLHTGIAIKSLIRYLDKNIYIKDVCRIPITATILAILYENHMDLPVSKTELYIKRFELLLRDWARIKNLSRDQKVFLRDKQVLLREIAYHTHIQHKTTFTQSVLEEKWDKTHKQLYPHLQVEDVLKEMVVYDGVITHIGKYDYSFGHLSFQEYLAAEYIIYTGKKNIFKNYYFDEWWRNTLIFCAGLVGDMSAIINELQEQYGLTNYKNLLYEMVSEAKYTPQTIRDFIDECIISQSKQQKHDEGEINMYENDHDSNPDKKPDIF